MNNFVKRTLSSVFFVMLVALSIFVHPYIFLCVFGILDCWAVIEFYTLVRSPKPLTFLSIALTLLLMCIAYLYNTSMVALIVGTYCVGLLCAMASVIFLAPNDFLSHVGNILISQVWIALPFALLHHINSNPCYSPFFLFSLFLLIWCTDVGAYCIGSLMGLTKKGNHKMCPQISPNKSWEGLIGGNVCALLGVLACASICNALTPIQWIGLAFVVSCSSVLGDLMESCFKRTVGIKDSGKFLPGHGGVLDRFDSLLLAIPTSFLYLHALPK